MISEKNIKGIERARIKTLLNKFMPFIVCVVVFFGNYSFGVTYNSETSLFNDKIIDVSAIFFGVFIGVLYLFEKLKENEFYAELMRFSKNVLLMNVIMILLSFGIILYNELLPSNFCIINKGCCFLEIDVALLLFSLYISFSALTLYFIVRFTKVLFLIIENK